MWVGKSHMWLDAVRALELISYGTVSMETPGVGIRAVRNKVENILEIAKAMNFSVSSTIIKSYHNLLAAMQEEGVSPTNILKTLEQDSHWKSKLQNRNGNAIEGVTLFQCAQKYHDFLSEHKDKVKPDLEDQGLDDGLIAEMLGDVDIAVSHMGVSSIKRNFADVTDSNSIEYIIKTYLEGVEIAQEQLHEFVRKHREEDGGDVKRRLRFETAQTNNEIVNDYFRLQEIYFQNKPDNELKTFRVRYSDKPTPIVIAGMKRFIQELNKISDSEKKKEVEKILATHNNFQDGMEEIGQYIVDNIDNLPTITTTLPAVPAVLASTQKPQNSSSQELERDLRKVTTSFSDLLLQKYNNKLQKRKGEGDVEYGKRIRVIMPTITRLFPMVSRPEDRGSAGSSATSATSATSSAMMPSTLKPLKQPSQRGGTPRPARPSSTAGA